MDTNKLKKFATEARNRLKAGIAAKMLTLGFDRNGRVPDHMRPQLMQGGSLWNGRLETEGFYHQWQALYYRVQLKGIKEVYEEAAYIWFNRLVAIRILQKNSLIEPVLDYVDQARTPRIVDEARMGRMPQMQERQRQLLTELLDDDSKATEQFAILVTAFCHENPILYRCFGAMSDYTELLLPNDILTEGGFIDMLNHTEFITDEDFRSPELIGWLYQFYISERKDEVFAKKGKFEADEIPAATQIFTPNWIVKYMVQNTIGRIYLDNNPSAAAEFKPKWKYLVEPSEPTPKESIYKFKELTELLTGDLACGSGHILNECFDLFYDLYIYEGYSRKEAIENIFFWNLRGVDLDTRAKQLATFALMLKACQKDASFADAHILPHVLSMPTPIPQEQVADRLQQFFRETPSRQQMTDLTAAFELMQDAESLGSIMKFDVAESTLLSIQQTLNYWQHEQFVPEEVEDILPAMELILTLTDKYAVLVMNPPYMVAKKMEPLLYNYVNSNYSLSKMDLCTIFMDVAINKLAHCGKYGMINMQSWMFSGSFEEFRIETLKKSHIDSLLYLGVGTFEELNGEVVKTATFVMSDDFNSSLGLYVDLSGVNSSQQKRELYLSGVPVIKFKQDDFSQIEGNPLAFWIEEKILNIYARNLALSAVCKPTQGLATADNARFLRFWVEVDFNKVGLYQDSGEAASKNLKKWIPYNKGGKQRRWYGNQDLVVNWDNNGEEIRSFKGAVIRNPGYYFKPSISWGLISGPLFRYYPKGFIYDVQGMSCFFDREDDLLKEIAWLNSKVFLEASKVISPSGHIQIGEIAKMPSSPSEIEYSTKEKANTNIAIAKLDWDSHETSWDFEANPLVALRNEKVAQGNLESSFLLSDFVEEFETQWTERFMQLHQNEEELNRQFISIYGLEDELTPNVPLNEITILQQGEISIVHNGLEWHEDVLMKQLISYAVGVWMGRYKLGKKGLHIAHPNPTDQELQEYWYGGVQVYIDDDGLIPVLPQNSPFDDNLPSRISDFIRITFGEDKLTENLNYIEQKLGQSIDQYVQKDFWKDHKKMYQNRPICWLFSSKKGAFKCLAYMHRMNAYTAERVRSNYLLPYIEYLQNQIGDLESRAVSLTTAENRKLANLRKALDECQEYHERLQVVAEQAIGFDLDDGVVVNYAKFGDILAKIK